MFDLQLAFAEIVHLKMIDRTERAYVKAAVTGSRDEPVVEGDLAASPESAHELCVNLRAALPADEYGQLLPVLEAVSVSLKQVLHKAGEPIEHVYFPGGGFVSDLTVLLMFPFTPPPSFAPPRSDAATRQVG